MFRELRQLKIRLRRGECYPHQRPNQNKFSNIPRNYKELSRILVNYGLSFRLDKKELIISKSRGDFFINLIDGTVKFSPLCCLKCSDKSSCQGIRRKLCIIGDSDGWANFTFSKMDMLVLAKIFAIYYDLLPTHIEKQIKERSNCLNEESRNLRLRQGIVGDNINNLDNALDLDSVLIQAPPIRGVNPPPRGQHLNSQNNTHNIQFIRPDNSRNLLKLKKAILMDLKRLRNTIKHHKN